MQRLRLVKFAPPRRKGFSRGLGRRFEIEPRGGCDHDLTPKPFECRKREWLIDQAEMMRTLQRKRRIVMPCKSCRSLLHRDCGAGRGGAPPARDFTGALFASAPKLEQCSQGVEVAHVRTSRIRCRVRSSVSCSPDG
ncbi:hypothetical protein SAMN04515666_11513 [Bosea lupini]|uniref:Uncharacterized protein n=1 Tax=Bosea lupini TaxID=1036779 RepID=A0A1H7ZL05_9HYPH|nr:hypothetical protein SAMN04515666_11513 [Bosea lupini]